MTGRKNAMIAMFAACLAMLPMPLQAQLPAGAQAPLFATRGAIAGKPFAYNLRSARRRGPVVIYFFPKAFTQGCTLETRAFAEAIDRFRAAGASVIGMSTDDLPTLQRFSTEECRGRFPVAMATPDIISAYDVAMQREGAATGLASRTSYVIARDGTVRFVHANLDYRDHVRLTLEAVEALRPARR